MYILLNYFPCVGPVDTDSNDDLIFDSNGHPRNRSKSMFSLSRTTSTDKRQDLETFSECGSVSSEAPDFDTPLDSNAVLHYELDSSTANESGSSVQVINAGLNKIAFTLDKNGTCRLLGREFPKEEFVLSCADISSVRAKQFYLTIYFFGSVDSITNTRTLESLFRLDSSVQFEGQRIFPHDPFSPG